MKPFIIQGPTINDVWFQCVYNVFNPEYTYIQKIQRGSFANEQIRRQFYSATLIITQPWEDRIVKIPEGLNIPSPVDQKFVDEEYFPNYLMDPSLAPNETYKYSSRIHAPMGDGVIGEYCSVLEGTQMDRVIEMLKNTPQTNQSTIEIASPFDLDLCLDTEGHCDPPCCRLVSFKAIPFEDTYKLQMTLFFRSWDLWSGMPGNLGGFELLKQWVCSEVGMDNGPLIAYSDGLHLYSMYDEVAKIRLHMTGE